MAQLITLNNIDPSALTAIGGPKIASIAYSGDDTATAIAGGQTITLTGAGFQNGASVYVDGTVVSVVTVVSGTVISFAAPPKAAGGYPLYVVNTDGGTATFPPGIQYSGTPTWATNSGSLGSVYETQAVSVVLSAVSDSVVTYAVATGALPNGTALNANTGNISGTANLVGGSTTYNFAVDAVDAENQDTRRNFSITVNPDVVTFNSPSAGTTYTNITGDVFSLTLNATSILGKTITYTANVLPGGLSIVGSGVTGTFSSAATTASLITATAADTLKTGTRILNWTVTAPTPAYPTSIEYLVVAGGGAGGGTGAWFQQGGGGGGGGLLSGTASITTAGTYAITIGAGGAYNATNAGGNGSLSSWNSISTTGGGGGGAAASPAGKAGGSGGGAGNQNNGSSASGGTGVSGPPRQGFNGGSNATGGSGSSAGGGGGAGGNGANGVDNTGGNGGIGVQSSISGTATYYAGGGYGVGTGPSGTNGLGGGNTANQGGGGRGGKHADFGGPVGTAGGSGVVILRYVDTFGEAISTTGSPTVTVAGGFRVYTYTSSGSITF